MMAAAIGTTIVGTGHGVNRAATIVRLNHRGSS